MEAKYKVDEQRIYVTGLSMGGFGTWSLAIREPHRLAAIAPICGGGNPIAAKYIRSVDTPAWAFHGAKDTVVPLSKSEEMIDVLKQFEIEARLTVYPDAGHDSWTKAYNDDQLYEWLLAHKREG
jgi:predicted peptidase